MTQELHMIRTLCLDRSSLRYFSTNKPHHLQPLKALRDLQIASSNFIKTSLELLNVESIYQAHVLAF